MASLSQFVHFFLPGKLPLEFHLCAGTNPDEDDFTARRNIPLAIVLVLSLITNLVVPVRIRYHQVKYERRDQGRSFSLNMTDLTTGLTLVFFLTVAITPLFVQYSIIPANLNKYPNYLYVPGFQIVFPKVFAFIVLVTYFARNNLLRTTISRQLKEDLSICNIDLN